METVAKSLKGIGVPRTLKITGVEHSSALRAAPLLIPAGSTPEDLKKETVLSVEKLFLLVGSIANLV